MRRRALLILAAGLLIRLVVILTFVPPVVSDAHDYDLLGRSIAGGLGYSVDGSPTAYRLPLYPYLLSVSYSVSGSSHAFVKIVQAAADACSAWLVFLIASLLFSEQVAILALLIFGFFPIQILYTTFLLTETIFTTLFLFMIWLIVRPQGGQNTLTSDIVFGLTLGLSLLIKPAAVVALPLYCSRHWSSGTDRKPLWRSLAIILLVASAVLCPWAIRNYRTFGRFSLTSNAGINFWIGAHDGANGGYAMPRDDNPLDAFHDEWQRSDEGYKRGIEFIRRQPSAYAFLMLEKSAHFIAVDYMAQQTFDAVVFRTPDPSKAARYSDVTALSIVLFQLPFVITLLLATLGLICFDMKDRAGALFTGGAVLLWLAVHLAVYAGGRYRFPIVPLLIMGAAYAYELIRERRLTFTPRRLVCVTLLVSFFVMSWCAEYFHAQFRSNTPIVNPDHTGNSFASLAARPNEASCK